MKYAKSAILAAVTLLALPIAGEAPVVQSKGEFQVCGSAMVVSTSNLTAVVKVVDRPDYEREAYGDIDWGDGSVSGAGCCCPPMHEMCCTAYHSHVYDCPGTYTITTYSYPFLLYTVVIGRETVAIQPLPGFELVAISGGNNEVRVETADVINRQKIVDSTVDWGDGTSEELFEWIVCSDTTHCLPPHTYASLGEFEIVVVNRFGGNCPFERSDTLLVSIDTITPVERKSWGAIKALYR